MKINECLIIMIRTDAGKIKLCRKG